MRHPTVEKNGGSGYNEHKFPERTKMERIAMIGFDAVRRLFHLRNASVSLVLSLRPDEEGALELLTAYLGAPLDDPAACLHWINQREGASFVPKYKSFLKAAAVMTAEDAGKVAGIDLTDPAFWRSALEGLAKEVEEFGELCCLG